MTAFVLLPELLGLTASEAAGFAVGTATAFVLRPVVQIFENEAWALDPTKPLPAGVAAAIVAEDVEKYQWGEDEAGNTGINPTRFRNLYGETLNAPGTAEMFAAWRRGLVDEAAFEHGLRKAKLETRWDPALKALKDERLDPSQIALGIVRSLLEDPNFLPVSLDTSGGKVPAYGVSPIDPVKEAEAAGIDKERLRVMVGEIGLPMALQSAAAAVFRGIINRSDFNRAVLEGDTRPEWADAIFEQARQIPSVADYVNAHIRGWIDKAAMHEGAARHGMSVADVDLLYLRTGRPAAPGQMATAYARGINGPDGVPMNKAQFLKGIAESDIRPEWGEMLFESIWLYPPLFQLNRLVQADAIDVDTAADWARKARVAPEVIVALRKYWSQAPSGAADTHLAKAQTQLWGTLHRAYMAGDATAATVTEKLPQAGVSAAAVSQVLTTWDHEREIQRQRITPAQLKKAVAKAVVNPLTGQPWTKDEALAELLSRGWSTQDANTFLDTPSGK